MKKIIQKFISLILIMGMLIESVSPMLVYAEELEIPEVQELDFTPKGNIEVETHLILPIINHEESNIKFTIKDEFNNEASISLNDTYKDGYLEKNTTLGEQEIRIVASKRNNEGGLLGDEALAYLSINIYSLNKGKYTLSLSGKHFVTYNTNVELNDYSKRVSITNEFGMFALGDLNNDNVINENDTKLMLEAIENNDLSYDLNLDGKIDIADLNYITANTKSDKKETTIENTSAIISKDDIKVELESTNIEGDINNIFKDEGSITLKGENDEPIKLALDFNEKEGAKMSEIKMSVGDNAPTDMEVEIETVDGEKKTIENDKIKYANSQGIHKFTDEIDDNTIVIDLKGEVAVKKVTIVIKDTSSSQNIADIAKVEFLNNVKVETEKPNDFYTPKNINVDCSKSEELTVSFADVPNVTGYEIKINGEDKNGVVFQTSYNKFTIEDLKNYKTYKISVRSVNGEWRSDWSEPVDGTPTATRIPPVVNMVIATPGIGSIDFSWKDMDDTKSYNIYYRVVGNSEFEAIKNINGTKYTLKNLKAGTEYEAYITGNNDLGEGTGSKMVKARTLENAPTITPKYKLINTPSPNSSKTSHIKGVKYTIGSMINGDDYSMVDDNYLSYWEEKSWQAASHYYKIGYPIIELDDTYKMDEFVLTVPDSYPYVFKGGTYDKNAGNKNDILLHYWNKETNYTEANKKTVQGVLTVKEDKNKRKYYLLKLEEPIEADAVQFGLTVANNGGLIDISEVKFYEYDSLVDDVANLFEDDLRLTLVDGVTEEKINELRKRAEIEDNGELNPYHDIILSDLDYAEKILKDEKIDDVIELNPNISNSYNGHLGFAMTISDYQPLGVVARAGEKIAVYVGSKGNVNAEIVYTQYHAEANAWQTKSAKLVKGENIFTVPQIGSSSDERGGSLYIRYTSTPDVNKPIKVRVSGGTKIPVLDLSLITNTKDKKEAISKYIKELQKYNASLEKKYSDDNLTFDPTSSVLGSTEVVTKHGLWSVSSVATEKALKETDKIEQLYETTEAFDEMMEMFYRQKGLSEDTDVATDKMPKARINIRYMQMFDGAFMYAGGYHIGIEYASIGGLFTAKRNTDTKTGYFGWGISHEIGHQINQSSLVHAEVTNNVYAMLAQTSNDNDKSRLESSNIYEKIYEKVTSHTLGKSQNVFITLGMYWQLHLAYDYNTSDNKYIKTFNDTNSIYSRINKLTRSNKLQGYSKDDLLYIYASIAANKDLLDFFTDWGLIPTENAQNYIKEKGLQKETRKISYLNDLARRYKLSNKSAMSSDTTVTSNSKPNVNNEAKEITLNFYVNKDSDKILGYEIIRNGVSIAFITNSNTYVDHIGAENNRAYTYQVIAYDYLLNKTEAKTYEEVKISYDGSLSSKDTFSIESNFKEPNEIIDPENDLFDYDKLSVNNLIDNNKDTFFNGTERIKSLTINGDKVESTTNNTTPYIIINLNAKYAISGIKYQAIENNPNTITKYKISVSKDKVNWTTAKEGTFNLTNNEEIVYFMRPGTTSEKQLYTFDDISYVKIEAIGNTGISGKEIDIIAPPGDNIDIDSIGKLSEDYIYDKEKNSKIEKGSVIIKGTYRGEPAFNIITITDSLDDKKRFNGYELIFAELNEDKSVYEVASGTWMYVLTKEEYEELLGSTNSIRANLYRVNDANTNEDARLTSTSFKYNNLVDYNNLNDIEIKE